MRDRPGIASFIYALVAVAHLAVALAAGQSLQITKLSPEVREYVKLDDAAIARSHVRVIDGTGQTPRADQTLIIRDGIITAIRRHDLHTELPRK